MGIIVTDDKHYKNIASAIREKTNSEETYAPEKMPSGVDEVFEAGKTAEWSEFWDEFQQNGTRTIYDYAFCGTQTGNSGYSWTDVTFKPKYDFKPTNATRMFYGSGITDLKSILDKQGVVLDLTNCYNAALMFGFASYMTHAPEMDISNVGINGAITLFSWCTRLEIIDKLIFRADGQMSHLEMFKQCKALKEVRFGGVIGQDISFSFSPLSVESMKDAILHLKNYKGTDSEFSHTITFTSACISLLEAEGATSPNGNTWIGYIADLGWDCG